MLHLRAWKGARDGIDICSDFRFFLSAVVSALSTIFSRDGLLKLQLQSAAVAVIYLYLVRHQIISLSPFVERHSEFLYVRLVRGASLFPAVTLHFVAFQVFLLPHFSHETQQEKP